jgi:hypothetical protein
MRIGVHLTGVHLELLARLRVVLLQVEVILPLYIRERLLEIVPKELIHRLGRCLLAERVSRPPSLL